MDLPFAERIGGAGGEAGGFGKVGGGIVVSKDAGYCRFLHEKITRNTKETIILIFFVVRTISSICF